jgi:hypothetical protein
LGQIANNHAFFPSFRKSRMAISNGASVLALPSGGDCLIPWTNPRSKGAHRNVANSTPVSVQHYEGDVVDLGLFFSVENNELGEMAETELIPGGRDIPVTNENKIKYIYLVANHRLNLQVGLTRFRPDNFAESFRQPAYFYVNEEKRTRCNVRDCAKLAFGWDTGCSSQLA